MRSSIRSHLRGLRNSGLLLLVMAGPSRAQSSAEPPAVLALADTLPVQGARAVVLFRARPTGRSVILLARASANPETIGGAIALLRRLERQHAGDDLSAIVPISGTVPTRPISPKRLAQLRSYLAEVNARPVTSLGDAGVGRWVSLRDDPGSSR